MGHGGGIITRPFDFAEVAAVLGEKTLDGGTLCVSPNINPKSRYKPYKFGNYNTLLLDKNGNENPILKSNNFGMEPATFGYNPYRALPWSVDASPNPGTNWLRFSDFDHYSHYAAGGISKARIYTSNPNDDRKLMLGGDPEGTEGKIIGEIEFSFNPSFEILPEDFKHPKITGLSLADFRFTLLFGPIQNGDSSFSEAPWVCQSPESIQEMVHGEGDATYERLEILLDRNISNQLKTWTAGSDDFLAILCLAPPIVKNANGRFSRWQIGSNQSNSLEFNSMGLVSLDMWGDSTVQTESVLFTVNGDWDAWQSPDPSKLPEEFVLIASSLEYLTVPDYPYWEPFTCTVWADFYDDGEGEQCIILDVGAFSPIWFKGISKIGKLAQYVEYTILDEYTNRPVVSGEVLVSKVNIGTPNNPTNSPYNIGFEEELTGEEIYINTLPSGNYKLQLKVRVEQDGHTIRYIDGKAYRQVMHDFYWEGGEPSLETDGVGMVYAQLNGDTEEYYHYFSV